MKKNRVKVTIFIEILTISFSLGIFATHIQRYNLAPATLLSLQISHREKLPAAYQLYRREATVDQIYQSMSQEEQVGQLFMISIPSLRLDQESQQLIETYTIGSTVLMEQNILSQQQVQDFITDIQSATSIPLLIATDQEGGTVARIQWDKAAQISQYEIGKTNQERFAYITGKEHAQTLAQTGIHMNLAPVLDISFTMEGPLMSRSLGADPQQVSVLGAQIIKAHQDVGIISTAKHFPGIGRTATDSHMRLPVIGISKQQLINEELLPFRQAMSSGIEVIMVGHALYPLIDQKLPSTLSPILVGDILRQELGFDQVIISDDLNMDALGNYPEKVVQAFKAGIDILLIIDTPQQYEQYIKHLCEAFEKGELSQDRLEQSVKRILKLKYDHGLISYP